ncbi:uncharacterized protein [Cardiocondyla obscurior]|uniref:uncharacterized protein n=1 Tax=Cardiocondyla obscurior TaxID=286306 RepID=UPI0039657657
MSERKKKRSRSRSHSRDHHSKRQSNEKFCELQNQIQNLTKVVESLVTAQKSQTSLVSQPKEISSLTIRDDTEDKENVPDIDQDISEQDTSTNVLKALGIDPNDTKFKMIKYHPEMKNTWQKWKNEGLPDKNKKEILELYNRKADLYVEAPKLNLEIIPLFSEIAKKRDQHFVDTQNCVGTAITSLGTAVSMILDPPEEGIDEDTLTNYISHAGQILTDVFHQQSITRKSFITPQLNKNVKLVVENIFSDEWLYGDDLKEKVKDVKEIEKAWKLALPTGKLSSGGISISKTTPNKIQETIQILPGTSKINDPDDEPIFIEEIERVHNIAGRLNLFTERWKSITSDKYILKQLEGYRIPFTKTPIQKIPPIERKISNEEKEKLSLEIIELLKKGAIEECQECVGQFISPYFLVPKPDGTNRFIFNLKKLNEYLQPQHFKLEDIRSVLNLVSQGDYFCSIDLKDAYFLIPIYKNHKKFLRFRFEEKLYQFKCLPFGLCTSPYIFTKIIKPVINKLRLLEIVLVIYLDDFLFIHKSKNKCEENTKKAIKLLESLGFIIKYEKSCLTADQKIKYLGFIIDSVNLSLNLPDKKKNQILNFINNFQIGKSYKIRDFARFLGVLASACPAINYGFIHCKRIERQKFLALKFNGGDYEGKIYINKYIIEDFNWWYKNAIIGSNPFKTLNFKIEIFSDSSLSGWGCYCNNKKAFGFWNEQEKRNHINYLELLVAFFALKCFASNLLECEILIRIDNMTAISYINRAGGVQFPHLSELSRKIWEWCEEKKLWLKASYIPSTKNNEADEASRNINIDSEWEISQINFKQIENQFGPFSVDLFASRLNKKCQRFYSRFPDPEAESIDAFTKS